MAWTDELDFNRPPNSKEWSGHCRKQQARWDAHTTGQTYELSVVNRTSGHRFKVHQNGSSQWQAVLRYYRGLDGGTWVWHCTKVLSARLLHYQGIRLPYR